MADSIFHQHSVPIQIKHGVHSNMGVALFDSGVVIVTIGADYGAMSVNVHIDGDSLRAIAKLLADAVDALPAKVEEAA